MKLLDKWTYKMIEFYFSHPNQMLEAGIRSLWLVCIYFAVLLHDDSAVVFRLLQVNHHTYNRVMEIEGANPQPNLLPHPGHLRSLQTQCKGTSRVELKIRYQMPLLTHSMRDFILFFLKIRYQMPLLTHSMRDFILFFLKIRYQMPLLTL